MPNKLTWSRHVVLTWLALAVMLMAAGCARVVAPASVSPVATATVAAPVAPELGNVDPRHILAELSPVERLDAAAAELAAALGVAPDLVRARHIPGGCTLCTDAETGGNSDPIGLDVAAVAAVAQPGDLIHLFVGRFVCVFRDDGAVFTPKSCHVTSF